MDTGFATVLFALFANRLGIAPSSDPNLSPVIMRHPTLNAVIVCDEPVHDIGTIWAGPRLEHAFEVHNEGADTAWVRVGYHGVSGSPCIFEAPPGQAAFVQVSLDSTKLRGTFAKKTTLTFVEPPNPISCAQCGSWVGGHRHASGCGATHVQLDRCVRYGSPD